MCDFSIYVAPRRRWCMWFLLL